MSRERDSSDVLTFGGLRLSATDFMLILAFGSVFSFLWLTINYGLCNPTENFMTFDIGVIAALCLMGLLAIVMYRRFEAVAAFISRPLFLLACSLVCAACSFILVSHLLASSTIGTLIVLIVCICTFCILLFHVLRELICHIRESSFLAVLHASLVLSFILYAAVLLLNGLATNILFAALPLIAALAIVAFYRMDASSESLPASPFWISPHSVVASSIEEEGVEEPRVVEADEHQATSPQTSTRARRALYRMAVLFGLFGFYVAFERLWMIETTSWNSEQFLTGASSALAILAILGLVILVAIACNTTLRFVHAYYIIGGFGLCFAPMIIVLTGVNFEPVRIIEDGSYALLMLSATYAMFSCVHRHRLQPDKVIAISTGIACLGVAAGWGAQLIILAVRNGVELDTVYILALTFIVLAYFLFGFSPDAYNQLIVGALPSENVTNAGTCNSTDRAPRSAPADDANQASGEGQYGHVTFKEAAESLAQKSDLSKRETEILFHMIKGHSDQRIADELTVSYHTVRSHVRHIYTKMDVHDRESLLDAIAEEQDNSQPDAPATSSRA